MADERGGVSDKSELKKALRKKIDYILRKPKISPVEAYNLVKKFFQAFTGNDYEFTREELVYELDKVYLEEGQKMRLQEIVERLGEVEFSQPQYSQEELKDLLREFGEIVDDMVHEEHIDLGFWDKMAKKFKSHAKNEGETEEESKSSVESFLEEVDETEGDNVPVPEESEPEPFNPADYEVSEEEPPTPKEEPPIPQQSQMEEAPPAPQNDYSEAEEPAPWTVPVHKEAKNEITEELLLDTEFDKVLDEFHDNMDKGNVIMAKLDYEEMKHAYDKMDTDDKHEHYQKLQNAYEKLQGAMKTA